jgi:(2Fe-2S) ferredoxin
VNSTNSEPSPSPSSALEPCLGIDPTVTKDFSACVEALGLNQIQRHLFLCADQTAAKCCTTEAGLETWDYLKRRLKELGLDRPSASSPTCIYRTKANCLRVCQQGPILLVYPDGVWYYSVTPEVMERILQEHIIGHHVVTEYVLCQQPLKIDVQTDLASFATDNNASL